MLKIILTVAGITAVLCLGLLIDAQSRSDERADPPRVAAGSGVICATGLIEGSTEPIELRPRLSGRIDRIAVEEGQVVEAGALLIALDDAREQGEVELAKADVELYQGQYQRLLNGARSEEKIEAAAEYRARLEEARAAEKRFQRKEKLRAQNRVTEQELDDLDAQVKTLEAQAEAAQARMQLIESPPRADDVRISQAHVAVSRARLEMARTQLSRTRLTAPRRAQVLKIEHEEGEMTGPDSPTPTVVLSDTSSRYVRAFVEEIEAPRVRVGMPARITADGLADQAFHGRVTRVSPRMGPKEVFSDRANERVDTSVREVWIELDDGEPLVVGLRVDVVIDPEGGPIDASSPARSASEGSPSGRGQAAVAAG